MTKYNANNERIKRQYFTFLKEAKRQNESSVDAVAKAISRFEAYNKHRDFKAFHFQQAVGFKQHLGRQTNQQTGKPISKATLHSTLGQLKTFFQWLAMQPGYKSRINYSDSEYFNLSEKDVRIATAKRPTAEPTVEQIKHVIRAMPYQTDIERRNRALIAFTLATGARDSAIASMKLQHIDLVGNSVFQDAREVKTKFSKTFTTYFFPVGDEILEIFLDWVRYLKDELLWGNDDPLFPKTHVTVSENRGFVASGLARAHWSNATPIRTIFRESFESAGLPYFNPHSFRKTLVNFGQQLCQTPEQFKAWSQNLGHEDVLTTLYSYGEVQQSRQGEIIQALKNPQKINSQGADVIAHAVIQALKIHQMDFSI
ncbi:tyrosine-type recombinase/integrase [Methylomonas albis]|uniref:Site-specific integrase n=1 Tax=Methylomonas albis TaxID=1854563 RepID=A0ABR9D409_9GAMM|nr:site-specific integrase [Methylomonas albis]MBD9357843.1 site-specific integrase [Methylomonas albis]